MNRQTRWIYRDMIDVYYDTEKYLSLDIEQLCDQIGVESDEEIRIVEKLLRFKFEKTENGYSHSICDKVIADYHSKSAIAKANGKLGGRPKKPIGFQSGSDQDAICKQDNTGSQTNQEPITKNHKPTTKEKTAPEGDFFEGVDPQIVSDFKALRTKHRAPITKTALNGIKREAILAGFSFEDALKMCCERNWRGFKADWIKKDISHKEQKFDPTAYVNRKRNIPDDNIIDIN